MDKVWKVGLVGARRGSSYGRLMHRDPRFEIAALCDADGEHLGDHQKDVGLPDAACFLNYKDFIGSGLMEAVIIGTPILFHAEQAVMALDAGIHVMSEVTASNTVEGCRNIFDAARRSGKIYMLAENTIFRPLFAEWEALLKSGRLGEIIYAEADYLHPIPSLLVDPKTGKKHWRADRPPIHYCSHSLGPILYLTGDRIVRAMGIGNEYRILPGVGPGAIDIQLGVFETERKMVIKMTRTQAAPRHLPIHYYHMQGTNGFVETDRRGADREKRVQHGLLYIKGETDHTEPVSWPEIDPDAPDHAILGGHGTSDYNTLLQFLRALDAGKKPALDEVRAWDLTVPGLIAAESALQGGKWMDVPLPE